ncbi:unconventional myosin [Tanacetum coccineum]
MVESENHSPQQPPQAHPLYGLNKGLKRDDDNDMFSMHSLPRPVTWQGSHTECVIAAMSVFGAKALGNASRIIQQQMCAYIASKEYISIRKAAIQLQASWRGLAACKNFKILRRKATPVKIQKEFKRFIANKSHQTLRVSTIALQTGLREMTICDEVKHRNQTMAAIYM